ncbi:hypothetical protein CL620_06120 [archaeon]|nr:hypothetical protein [archaeon]
MKFPEVRVKLTGVDGNAFAILYAVSSAMENAGLDEDVVEEYMNEAMNGDYDHLLATTMNTVEVF